ncbi:MAG: efflux RND transporter permease subunit [Luteimonas sp.]
MIADRLRRHPGSILLALTLFAIGGLLSLFALPVGLFPRADFPRLQVSVDAGDRPVDSMVIEVTRPLERALRSVPGVTLIRSTSSRGSAQISLGFDWGHDMVTALLQAESVANRALADLPPGTTFISRRMDPTVFPVLGVSLASKTRPLADLWARATYTIAPELSSVDGVAQVEVLGGEQPEYQVLLDPARLRSLGLTPADVTQALNNGNVSTAVGRLEDRNRLYLALSDTRLHGIDDIRRIVLRSGQTGIVTLGDLADVRIGVKPAWTRVNAQGRDAVLININQQRGANTVAIAKDVKGRLADLQATLPSDITITPYYNQSELIVASAGSVRDAILIGAALAGVILLLFLRNGRITLIVSLVLPSVLLATCMLLLALGQSFNIMTLGGMAAAVGLVVDDAVVMIEHIARRLAEHNNNAASSAPETATTDDTDDRSRANPPILRYAMEMLRPLTGSSAATVAVFLPLTFLGGVAGAFFRPLALTMAATLTISYLVALLAVPLLARSLLRASDAEALENGGRWFSRVRETSTRALERTLQRPLWLLLPVSLLVIGGTFGYFRLGSGFMPRMDEGGFIFDYRAAPGTSLSETDRLIRQVETLVRGLPETESYSRRTGLQLGGGLTEANEGDIFIKLKPPPRRGIEAVMSDLRQQVQAKVPGLEVETAQLMEDLIGDLLSNPQPIEIKLFGPDVPTLRMLAGKVADRIGKLNGVVEVFDGTRIAGDAIEIRVDRVRAAREGLAADAVTQQIDALLAGTISGHIQSGEQLVGIRVWTSSDMRRRVEQIGDLPMRSPDGQTLPLRRVAQITVVSGQAQQDRDNLRPTVAVTGRLEGRDLGSAMVDVKQAVHDLGLPSGYSVEYGGLYHEQQQSFRELLIVFVSALLIVATLLMFLYERVAIVVSILGTALLTLPGVFLGLWITGSELDLSSMMGLTMIIGIVTEVAVFYFAELDTTGEIDTDSLLRAARMRLRPILMTSTIAILALMPLALGIGSGSEMQRPLAITIISGLLVAVPLVLLVMPALFLILDRLFRRRLSGTG